MEYGTLLFDSFVLLRLWRLGLLLFNLVFYNLLISLQSNFIRHKADGGLYTSTL